VVLAYIFCFYLTIKRGYVMQKINTSMGFKQSFIIFLFTPIALVIAIVAAGRA
jgi:predicted membrane protein